ncbi:hypothetical protein EDB81DRAFT_659788 [Dactylonectria macrodidyma]|uniref:Uncharacterized protein n=1 Tax=Dactylonectria macrodidyma TaxID=307937 RepID=A0A9P9E6B7_9HYPO|nr:hypothetical protein EDB81DRAFT_659788 [Dactylonectria macrodidyma]
MGPARQPTQLSEIHTNPASRSRRCPSRQTKGSLRPEGGPHRILIRFTPKFTKRFLGPKENIKWSTMTIPEIMFDASLLLSPHVLLLGKLFRHEAFENPSFTTPDSLSKLNIYFDEYELPIPLKKSMFDIYVFRDTIKTALNGYVISENKNITYAMMAKWTRVMGEIVGFTIAVIFYTLRYNAANEFDQSPNISDGLRNLILGHADSDPFRRHYLGRVVNVDTMAVVRHKPRQQALMHQATSVGCSVSKRRSTELTAEQSAAVNDDPLTLKKLLNPKKLLQRQRILCAQQQLDVINKELIGERARLRRERKRQIRKDWSREQAVKDIERQLAGKPLERPHESSPDSDLPPAQKRLLQALTAPVGNTFEEEYYRHTAAIEAVIAYCSVQEGPSVRRPRIAAQPRKADNPPAVGMAGHACTVSNEVAEAITSVIVRDETERPRRCFLCGGFATTRLGLTIALSLSKPNLTSHTPA